MLITRLIKHIHRPKHCKKKSNKNCTGNAQQGQQMKMFLSDSLKPRSQCSLASVPLSACIPASHLVKRSLAVKRQAIMSHSRTATWGLLIIGRLWEQETTAQLEQPRTQTPRQGQVPGPEHTGDRSCLRTSDMFSVRKVTTNKKESLPHGK